MELKIASDVGYSSVKADVNGEEIKFPSAVATLRKQDVFDPITFSSEDEEKEYFDELINHMDVSIASSSVKTPERMLVGLAAVKSTLSSQGFNVADLSKKSESDLALILQLAMIAASSVREAYFKGEDLDKQINVTANLTTSLPVLEGKKGGASERYKDRYLNGAHVVTLHNFKSPITVKIKFDKVIVALEGETARYALGNADKKLKSEIKKDFDKHYPALSDVDADFLATAPNVLMIDIGEGTTDLVLFTEKQIDFAGSTSLPIGYGNALEEAISQLNGEGYYIENRLTLSRVLSRPTNSLNRGRQGVYKNAVRDQLDILADQIVTGASSTLRKASDEMDLIYIMGGGSIPLQESSLREKLEGAIHALAGDQEIPIVWIGKDYAQQLNEMGLKIIQERVM